MMKYLKNRVNINLFVDLSHKRIKRFEISLMCASFIILLKYANNYDSVLSKIIEKINFMIYFILQLFKLECVTALAIITPLTQFR